MPVYRGSGNYGSRRADCNPFSSTLLLLTVGVVTGVVAVSQGVVEIVISWERRGWVVVLLREMRHASYQTHCGKHSWLLPSSRVCYAELSLCLGKATEGLIRPVEIGVMIDIFLPPMWEVRFHAKALPLPCFTFDPWSRRCENCPRELTGGRGGVVWHEKGCLLVRLPQSRQKRRERCPMVPAEPFLYT